MSERFIVTKEHRRFTEFADSVRRGHTIGLCFGSAGVGKTVASHASRRIAEWWLFSSPGEASEHQQLGYWPTALSPWP